MKIGIALNMLSEAGRPDVAVVSDHLAMGDLAEPLGFNSLFALEHHFTGYAMSPAPLQLLAYFAGRTKRITFGTSVIVLPWHDPIRVAEEIALLDILCGGRCLFGFGRGAASVEYAGFRIPMGEARPRFAEAAQLIRKALARARIRVAGRVLSDPAHRDPAAPDLASRRAFLCLLGQPGIGRDHGQARLWHPGRDAERMAEGGGEHRRYREIALERRPQPAAADHPDQRLLRRKPRRGAGPGDAMARQEMAVDRQPLPFLRRPSRHGQRLRDLRQDGQDLCPTAGRRGAGQRHRVLCQDPDRRHAARTASSRSPNCSG